MRFPGAVWCWVRGGGWFSVGVRFDHFFLGQFGESHRVINPPAKIAQRPRTIPMKRKSHHLPTTWHYQLTFFSVESEQKFCVTYPFTFPVRNLAPWWLIVESKKDTVVETAT